VKSWVKGRARRAIAPLAAGLAGLGVEPNHVTLAGLGFSLLAGVFLAFGRFHWAAAWLLLGSLSDMLDGAIARTFDRGSRFGAFLDSTVDRYAELFFFSGVVLYFHHIESSSLYVLLALLAAGGSFGVSYARARAEGLGVDCSVGVMERPERLVLLILACLVGPLALRVVLWILTPLVFYTVWQRIRHVRRRTES